jgi:glycine/D-amino acid oxidase-like deaminating enzyme
MTETADVVVVGAGLFGTSIAYQLARRGAGSVLLIDQGPVCSGDSGLCFSMVRRHYSNEATARLAIRGVDVIQRWNEEVGTGDSGFVRTGYLLTVPEERLEALRANVEHLRSWGLDTWVVTPDEIAEIEPLLDLDRIAGAAYEPDGGFADTFRITLSWFAEAIRLGARTALGRRVTGFRVEGGRVRAVETDAGAVETDVVVNATGAWAPDVMRAVGVELPISLRRVQVAYVRQPADRPQAGVLFSDVVSNLVLRPDRAGLACVVAYQPEERVAARDECRQELDPSYESAVRAALSERFPAYADAAWAGGFAGAYDYTPDWNPLLGWTPGIDGLYLALGWSGHGFKLAPAVGEVVADEVLGRVPAIDVGTLRPDRFEKGQGLALAYGSGARA